MLEHEEQNNVNIVLVDDHAILISGLKLLLQKRKAFQVAGVAESGKKAMELYKKLKPHLMILDISLPDMNGLEVLKHIKTIDENAKIIVLTMYEDEEYVSLIMEAGASGYIPKAAVDEELYTAIDTVMEGYIYLRPKEVTSMMKFRQSKGSAFQLYSSLSPREKEIMQLMVKGYSLTEIAEKLIISIKTVDTHKTRIFQKLNIHKKSELVEFTLKNNLFDLPS
ncbi:response regulator [Oceanobacillus jeddahense]|uniref:Response regulator transcription factor n=1 Tax=Oceanobacillus jeddahense TaxID=1462527 RepID=A0ABY5JW63_9BACI|nr:response regulator transcription factor [Oceanobacillus jeddahense]UUI04623.1 response regulator transcription factor [Oceanobacillus jeddahense]